MNQYEYMSFYNMYQVDDNIWVNNIVTNDLFRLDKDTLQVLEIVDLQLEKHIDRIYAGYFIQMVGYGNCLYLFPFSSTGKMVIYDFVSKEIRYCGLGLEGICREYDFLFFEGVCYGSSFWIFPPDLEVPLLVYDFKTEQITYDWKWNEKVAQLCGKNKSLNRYIGQQGKYVYVQPDGTSNIIISDLESGKVNLIHIPLEGKEIHSIAVDEEYIWMIMVKDDYLYRCRKENVSDISIFKLDCTDIAPDTSNRQHFTRIVCLGDKVAILPSDPGRMKDINIFDKKAEQIIKISDENFPVKLKPLKDFRIVYDCYWGYVINGRKLFLCPCTANMALQIDIDDYTVDGDNTFIYAKEWVEYFTKKFYSIEYRRNGELGDMLISRYGLDIINGILCMPKENNLEE